MTDDDKDLARKIGRSVAYYRRGRRLTQVQLAERIKSTAMAVSKVERGAFMPSLPMLARIARALDEDLDTLLVFGKAWPYGHSYKRWARIANHLEGYSETDVTEAVRLMRMWLAGRPREPKP